MEKVIEYDGIKWYLCNDAIKGFKPKLYYKQLNHTGHKRTGKNKRLHRYVWEKYNGEIPSGYNIHHKDHNTLNNDISNLELIGHSEHIAIHHFGMKHSEEALRKMSESHKNISNETRIKMSISASKRIRVPHSEETRKKMSESAIKRWAKK